MLTYDAWKWFKDSVDTYLIEGGGDLLAAASEIELPFIGPILVKLAAAGLGWAIDKLIDLIPHLDEDDEGDPYDTKPIGTGYIPDKYGNPQGSPESAALDKLKQTADEMEKLVDKNNSKGTIDDVINKKTAPMMPFDPREPRPIMPFVQAPFGTGAHFDTSARDAHPEIIAHRDKMISKKIDDRTQPFVNVGGPFVGYTQPGFNANRAQRMFNQDITADAINKYPSGHGTGLHTV
jgi:hypothetical protein